MTGQGSDAPPLRRREALRRIWQADKYPILGNHDWREAAILEKEALDAAAAAVPSPGDPPEFARWIAALRNPRLRNPEREPPPAQRSTASEALRKLRGRWFMARGQIRGGDGAADRARLSRTGAI